MRTCGKSWLLVAAWFAVTTITAGMRPAWAAGLATSAWPMLGHDALHTGNGTVAGPPSPATRWFQGGAAILPFEADHVPHGPQGAISSSAATSEVTSDLAGASKVWYFHFNTWTGRGSTPPVAGDPLVLRSERPSETATGLALSSTPQIFETSAAMPFTGATGTTLETLVYRNRDPYNNFDLVTSGSTYTRAQRLPAGQWTFDLWVTNSDATNLTFTVYTFPQGDDASGTRQALAGLSPVVVPIPQTASGALRHVVFSAVSTEDAVIGQDEGVAIGVAADSGTAVSLVLEGDTASRVVTPIVVPAVYAGADDGSVWAFDAATGNVLWSYSVADAVFRSSPAVGDDGTVYIGSMEDSDLGAGRLYAFTPDGTIKWIYPSASQTLYFRSGYRSPDVSTDFPADTAPLYTSPGSGTDANPSTIAQTGVDTSGNYVRFVPATTNATPEASLPTALGPGWLVEINSTTTTQTMVAGTWSLDLALRAAAANTASAAGVLAYRISKVEVVAGATPTLALSATLVDWTQADDGVVIPSTGATVWAAVETPTLPATTWARYSVSGVVHKEYAFIELAVRQAATTGSASGGWQLLLEGEATTGGPHSRVVTPLVTTTPLTAITASPVVSSDDAVYVGTVGGYVHAVAAATGESLWLTACSEDGLADELRSSPALYDTTVYVGSMNGRLYALDKDDGQILWRYPDSAEAALGAIESSPAIDATRDVIYFGSDDGGIYAIQPVVGTNNQITPTLQTGWPVATGGEVVATPAIAADGTVYVGSLDGKLYALTPAGAAAGSAWPHQTNGEIYSSAAVSTPAAVLYFRTTTPTLNLDAPTGTASSETSLSLVNGESARTTIGPLKFTQEFRSRTERSDSRMPTVLRAGTYAIDFFGRAAVSSGDIGKLSFKVYHCTATDASGQLIMAFPQTTMADVLNVSAYHVEQSLAADVTMATDDYLRVEVWGSATLDSGHTGAVYFDFEGQLASQLVTTASQTGVTNVYFATSVVRDSATLTTTQVGRVYCLSQAGAVLWTDPTDLISGFNPRGSSSSFTSFAASPAVGEADSVYTIVDGASNVVRRDPVVYLGGQDGVMYAFGPVPSIVAPPAVLPPQVVARSVLTLTKQATSGVVPLDGTLTYTLRYRNLGTMSASPMLNAVIEDPLPSDVEFVTGSASDGGDYDPATGAVTWSGLSKLATIWPGGSGQVSFQIHVPVSFPGVLAPLGVNGGGYTQPLVTLSTSEPDLTADTVTAPDEATDFVWGQPLYVRAIGLGKPGTIINSPSTAPARIYAQTGEQGIAAPVTVYAGWGNSYRLVFGYAPANDPATGTPPENQSVTYTIDVVPPVTDTRSGRAEEALTATLAPGSYGGYALSYPEDASASLQTVVFKVLLRAQGRTSGTRDISVTDAPNRAWTPYYWTVQVQQSTGGAAGETTFSGAWRPHRRPTDSAIDDGHATEYDFMIHNPLWVRDYLGYPSALALTGTGALNPGARADSSALTVTNRSQQSMSAVGRTPQPNVIRWQGLDLGQTGSLYSNTDPRYQARAENYLPAERLHLSREYLALSAGQDATINAWAEAPSYLSPGIYTAEFPVFVDLNGNLEWDRGEAKAEVGGTYDAFSIAVRVAATPRAQFGGETVDYAKLPAGVIAAAPTPSLLNVGNTDIATASSSLALDPVSTLALGRNDLPDAGVMFDANSTAAAGATALPLAVSPFSARVYKTPVGAMRPRQASLQDPDPLISYQDWAKFPSAVTRGGQALGAYQAPGLLVATAVDPITLGSVSARESSAFKARMVERRMSGYNWSTGAAIPGTNIAPGADWTGFDTLHVFWSSNARPDATRPTSDDAYMLWYATYDRATDQWTAPLRYVPAVDPLDTPSAPAARQHGTPGPGFDGTTEWLFWGASALRQQVTGGYTYDNRMLWMDWTNTSAIGDAPAVAGSGAAMSDIFRLQPRPPARPNPTDGNGSNVCSYVVLTEHGANQASLLRAIRVTDGASGDLEKPDAANGLSAVRDPSPFIDQNGDLWVAFSGASTYHQNYDIYLARYSGTAPSFAKVAFARVSGEILEPAAMLTDFASRHKAWDLSVAPTIYVRDASGAWVYIGSTAYTGPVDGWYTIAGASFDAYNPLTHAYTTTTASVQFHPGYGVVRFPTAVAAVACDYTPQLLRLTTTASDESNPSAFAETYRYVDDLSRLRPSVAAGDPADYDPRIWVFWTQNGPASGAAEVMYATLRETQASQWTPERAPRRVLTDPTANEFGLCAVKDPRYPQVWLLWSSTRGAPTAAGGGAVNCDIYYQIFSPDLP